MSIIGARPAVILDLDVRGIPRPQGSKGPTGRESSRGLPAWREAVRQAVAGTLVAKNQPPYTGPVGCTIGFRVARPKYHYRSNGTLRDLAPKYPTGRNHGDIDKLARSILDALTDAGLWRDDSQVVTLDAARRWCNASETPGVDLWVVSAP